ncbi:RecX family transcriptional regulator [Mycetocola tolaasinivorans]|uniref:Regulatory protein RecX n=1 Tax=Mycetocola tolaasinivorans TaxID=76635 RepID=A0A3L7ADJ4_9MICO|nr:regulatory protein RecX [Mycetocola tolaasinivorans]RLP77788.1 RecX family transcriptional regulator [Mycetocola tolaasinivorans]
MVRFIDEGPSTDGPESEGSGHARFGGADGSSTTPAWGSARSRAAAPGGEQDEAAAPSAYRPRFAPVWGVSVETAGEAVSAGDAVSAGEAASAGDAGSAGNRDAGAPTFAPAWGIAGEEPPAEAVPVEAVPVQAVPVQAVVPAEGASVRAAEASVSPALAPVTSLGGRRRARLAAISGDESGDSVESEAPGDLSAGSSADATVLGTEVQPVPVPSGEAIVSDFAARAARASRSLVSEAPHAATSNNVASNTADSNAEDLPVAAFEEYPDAEIFALTRRDAARPHGPVDDLAHIPEFIEGEDDEDDEEDEEVPPPTFEEAVEHLVRRLARSALSRAEVVREAEGIGLENDAAEAVAERLDELGYLDDAVLAEQLKHSLYDRKGKSRQVVAREMAQRKIPADIIEEALAEVADDDELAAATELAIKRVGQMSSLDDAVADRRLSGFLARRGYPGSIVREAVRSALATRGRRGRVTFR